MPGRGYQKHDPPPDKYSGPFLSTGYYGLHNTQFLRHVVLGVYPGNQHCGVASKRSFVNSTRIWGTTAESKDKSTAFKCPLYPFPGFLRW